MERFSLKAAKMKLELLRRDPLKMKLDRVQSGLPIQQNDPKEIMLVKTLYAFQHQYQTIYLDTEGAPIHTTTIDYRLDYMDPYKVASAVRYFFEHEIIKSIGQSIVRNIREPLVSYFLGNMVL
jgi:hypothetical protein